MSGTVGIIADAASRYTMFHQCLTQMHTPVNTAIDWRIGSDRARSRNSIVKESLDRGSEWVLFLDDDHSFKPDLLMTLLAADQLIVASLYVQRVSPFLPIAYGERDENGSWWPLDLTQCPEHGLVEVAGAGTGGMLIRSEVFHELGDIQWFRHTTEQSEDLHFCGLAQDAGIPVYVHLDAPLGHIAPATCSPVYHEGKWNAKLAFSHRDNILLPITVPTKLEDIA